MADPIPIPMEDDFLHHTDTSPFCYDPTCPCHEDNAIAIAQVADAVQAGLLTPDEASAFVAGKTL